MSTEIRAVASLGLLYSFRMLGLFMVLPVIFLYGEGYVGASTEKLGFALGIYGLTQALFQIPLGLCSDFIGRKPVIVIGLLVFAAGSLIAAFSESVMGLIIGRALQGSGAIASTIMALAADLTSEANRSKAMAAIGASIGLSFMLAMILGPVVAATYDLSGVFTLAAILSGLGVLIVFWVVPTPRQSGFSHRDSGAIPGLLWSTLLRTDLARLNVGIFSLHVMLTAMFVAIPGLLVSQASIDESRHWLVYLPLMLASFVLAVPLMMSAEKRGRTKEAFVLSVAVIMFSMLGLSQFGRGWGLIGGMFLFFAAFNVLEAMLPSLVSKIAPAGAKGTAMGLYSTAQFLGAFVGGVAGGYLVARYGVAVLFVFCAGMALLWLCVAQGMTKPRNLSSLCLPVRESVAQLDLTRYAGIEDSVYVSEEQILYLKVDRSLLDLGELKMALEPYSVTEC